MKAPELGPAIPSFRSPMATDSARDTLRHGVRPLSKNGIQLRIAILIERFTPRSGGVENVAWQVAHGLARTGIVPTIFAREIDSPAGSLAKIPAVILPVSPRWQPWRVHRFDRLAHRATSSQSDPSAPAFDVVHSFARTRQQDLYRAGGGSHADFLRRNFTQKEQRWRRWSPRHRILLAHERRVFADPAQRIQCSSRLVADTLIEREGVSPDRIFLLPNGVDLEAFRSAAARARGQQRRAEAPPAFRSPASTETGPLWLFPGSGWHRKGLDHVFAALASDRARHHRLWVAGRDAIRPWQAQARRLGIAERVEFLGEQADLAATYHAADAVVLPTRYDPFANITLEAAAAGRPVVTSSANGAAEWLTPDIRIVDTEAHPGALAAALVEFEDEHHRQSTGERLAKRAEGFDWPLHIEALKTEYARLAARRMPQNGHSRMSQPR